MQRHDVGSRLVRAHPGHLAEPIMLEEVEVEVMATEPCRVRADGSTALNIEPPAQASGEHLWT